MSVQKQENEGSDKRRFATTRALWAVMVGHRARYGAAIGAMVIASAFLYLSPLIPQIALDGVFAADPEAATPFVRRSVDLLGGRSYLRGHLWVLALLMVGVTALAGGFTYLRARWSAQASESIIRRLRNRVYDHLQRLPCRYFDEAETGDLIQRCTSDVETVRNFLENQVVEVGRALVMVLVPLPLMWLIDWRMTLAATGLLPIVFGFSMYFFSRVKGAFEIADQAEGKLTATLQENLTGIRVVRAFSRQEHEQRKFESDNETHRGAAYELYRLMAWYWSLSDLLTMLQRASVLAFGAYLLAKGELQVGAFFYFLTAVTMFVYPVRMLGRILTDLGKAMVSLGRLREILEEPDEAELDSQPAQSHVLDGATGHLRFNDVDFTHGDVQVLHGLDLEVPAGSTLGVLGPSGAGKSTMINLLLRLYELDSGRIEIDGVDIREFDRHDLRARIAVVMQQPFLYAKTIGENIGLGRPGSTHEERVAAAEVAAIDGSIRRFEKGYETNVGERGVTLSGGQRQRVALARALLQRPALLVLDDSLSAVDTETETSILDALEARRGRQTTIVIAHRLSSVIHADQIVVLEQGRITQKGTHEELSSSPGLYQRLWNMQRGRAVAEGA